MRPGGCFRLEAGNGRDASGKIVEVIPGEAVVDRFVESTDFNFECSEIVGRKFESIDDRAAYLRDGFCSDIFEALATQPLVEPKEGR